MNWKPANTKKLDNQKFSPIRLRSEAILLQEALTEETDRENFSENLLTINSAPNANLLAKENSANKTFQKNVLRDVFCFPKKIIKLCKDHQGGLGGSPIVASAMAIPTNEIIM